jgi:hypothetical protein
MTEQQKSAKTRAENAAKRIWADVSASKSRTKCTCKLRKGMSFDDLRKLKGGCTDREGNPGGRFVCPTLDKYRRLVGYPTQED